MERRKDQIPVTHAIVPHLHDCSTMHLQHSFPPGATGLGVKQRSTSKALKRRAETALRHAAAARRQVPRGLRR